MSYWPLDTPHRLATVMAAPWQTLLQLESVKVLLRADVPTVFVCPKHLWLTLISMYADDVRVYFKGHTVTMDYTSLFLAV